MRRRTTRAIAGRRRVALWTVAEMGASLFGLEGAKKFARERVRKAQET